MDILENNSWRMEWKVDDETKKDYLVEKRAQVGMESSILDLQASVML